jgi:hypothetical protein
VAGAILGAVSPWLSAEVDNPRVWGGLAFLVAATLAAATFVRTDQGPRPLPLGIAGAIASAGTGVMFWIRWISAREFIPVIAIFVGLGTSSCSAVLQQAGLYRIQERVWRLVELPQLVERARPNDGFAQLAVSLTPMWKSPLLERLGICVTSLALAPLIRDTMSPTARAEADAASWLGTTGPLSREAIAGTDSLTTAAATIRRVVDSIASRVREVAADTNGPLPRRRDELARMAGRLDMLRGDVKQNRATRGALSTRLARSRPCAEDTMRIRQSLRDSMRVLERRLQLIETDLATLGPHLEADSAAIATTSHRVAQQAAPIQVELARYLELMIVGALGFWLTWGQLASWATVRYVVASQAQDQQATAPGAPSAGSDSSP